MSQDTAHERSAIIRADAPAAGLYLVATPIGAARDITLRALDVLNAADVLVAEDTRRLRHLLDLHAIPLRGRPLLAYHDHNGARMRPKIMQLLAEGRSVAYASDAGTPLVADPGYRLAQGAREHGAAVFALPGPSAPLAALSVSGMPSDRFVFVGFPPHGKGARDGWLRDAIATDATTIMFESPHRIKETLEILCDIWPQRQMALCRELTKRFEEVITGTIADVLARTDGQIKGEIVLLFAPAKGDDADPEGLLRARLGTMSLRDAVDEVAALTGQRRRKIYDLALKIEGE